MRGVAFNYFIVLYKEGMEEATRHVSDSVSRIMPISKWTLWSVLGCGVAKYFNDIHGYTVVEDR